MCVVGGVEFLTAASSEASTRTSSRLGLYLRFVPENQNGLPNSVFWTVPNSSLPFTIHFWVWGEGGTGLCCLSHLYPDLRENRCGNHRLRQPSALAHIQILNGYAKYSGDFYEKSISIDMILHNIQFLNRWRKNAQLQTHSQSTS